jgi:serine/threonine-protein kinase
MRFGKYELVRRIAAGGMAEIYLAASGGPEGFKKHVAIKRILPQFADNDEIVAMFLDEARLVARFNHPNIVQVFDLGTIDDCYFVSMEYIHGASLARVLQECTRQGRTIPVEIAAKIVSLVCDGLEYAHTFKETDGTPLDLVHRDINPQNIMLSYEGGVKLLDFGIAKAASNLYHTRTASLKGKAAYMSPEQVTRKVRLDHRSDIFSLGATLYSLVTGKRPFSGDGELEMLMAVVQEPTPDPRELIADLPDDLVAVVARAMEKERDRRFASARAMGTALEQLLRRLGLVVDGYALGSFLRQLLPPQDGVVGYSVPSPATGTVRITRPAPEPAPEPAPATAVGSGTGPPGDATDTTAALATAPWVRSPEARPEVPTEPLLLPRRPAEPAPAVPPPDAEPATAPAAAATPAAPLPVKRSGRAWVGGLAGLAGLLVVSAGVFWWRGSIGRTDPVPAGPAPIGAPAPAPAAPAAAASAPQAAATPVTAAMPATGAPLPAPGPDAGAGTPPAAATGAKGPAVAPTGPDRARGTAPARRPKVRAVAAVGPRTSSEEAQRFGLLQVFVKPFGEVFVDGKSHGLTPLDGPVRLRAGEHTLRVRCDRTGKQETRRVRIEADRTRVATIDLR